MSEPFDQSTLGFYNEAAPTYRASGLGGVSRHLYSFLDAVRPGGAILELGCGGGLDAEAMVAAGFHVDPVEGVAAVARQAEARLNAPVRVMRFHELNASERYDAVWASASLIHVPRSALSSVLALIYRALKPGGVHFATFKSGDVEGRDDDGRYYNYPSAQQLIDFYTGAAEWEGLDVTPYVGGGFQGGLGPWLKVCGRREP